VQYKISGGNSLETGTMQLSSKVTPNNFTEAWPIISCSCVALPCWHWWQVAVEWVKGTLRYAKDLIHWFWCYNQPVYLLQVTSRMYCLRIYTYMARHVSLAVTVECNFSQSSKWHIELVHVTGVVSQPYLFVVFTFNIYSVTKFV